MSTAVPILIVLSLASPQQPAPAVAATEASPAVRATNGLGLALYRALDQEQPGKNLFVAPLSLTVAVAMVAEGARDETAAELTRALQLSSGTPLAELHAGLQTMLTRFRDGDGNANIVMRERIAALRSRLAALTAEIEDARKRGESNPPATATAKELSEEIDRLLPEVARCEMRVANALWVERTYPLVPAFVQALDGWYGTGSVNSLDIAGNAEAARSRINGWVEERTERHIANLIPPHGITERTPLVLGNAVFFRGEWEQPFDGDYTWDDDFLLAGGDRVRAMLMRDAPRKSVPYAAFTGDGSAFATPIEVPKNPAEQPATYPGDDGFTMIELPYKGGELAMLVLVPRSPDGLPRLESLLDATSLASWTTHLRRRTVKVAMLRFEQRGTCELSRALKTIGVLRAFDPDDAQFGGITADPDPMKAPCLAGVHHQVWLQVGEKGTEAAAGSGESWTTLGAVEVLGMIPFTPVFRADRPFLFLIRDTKSGAILFLGRVVDPRA